MKIVLFILLLVVGIIFANENDALVTVKFYNFVLEEVTLYSVILLSILLGFVGGAIYGYVDSFKVKSKLRTERKQKKELEEELENLRTLPLTSDADIEDVEYETEKGEDIVKAID
ncbi:lipopolysaccharide assembly protein LapA domain-containing protein [Thermodesulfobacteriota bacterium]